VIIDEWDAIFRDHHNDRELENEYVNFLRAMFKGGSSDSIFELVYLTGILPIKRYNTQSALNNFTEYTVINPRDLAPCYGFTEDEVKKICQEKRLDFNETRRWYDGYVSGGLHMYNPNSIREMVSSRQYLPFWGNTASYETVAELMLQDLKGLKDCLIRLLCGCRLEGINTSKFNNDISFIKNKDDAKTYLIHLGYLACTDGRVYVPDEEVRLTLRDAIESCNLAEYTELIRKSQELLEKTYEGDCAFVAQKIREYHEEYSSIIKYNSEESLANTVQNAYLVCIKDYYRPVREMPSGEGFADIVFIPKRNADRNTPALVIELKWNRSAQTALSQIKARHYTKALEDYSGTIMLIGISYDKKTKEHSCAIESIKKAAQ